MIAFLEKKAAFMRAANERLEASGFNYTSIADYILDRGYDCDNSPLTEDELEYVQRAIEVSLCECVPNECFANSQRILMHDPDSRLMYVEGYCLSRSIPVHHGWLSIGRKVVDVTLRHDGKMILGEIPEGWQYKGALFDLGQVLATMMDTKAFHTLLDNWPGGFPHYKEDRLGPPPDKLNIRGL